MYGKKKFPMKIKPTILDIPYILRNHIKFKTSILDIPPEILQEIFSYLHFLDRKSLRGVCQSFRQLAWDSRVTGTEVIKVRDELINDDDFNYPRIRISISSPIPNSNFLDLRASNVTYFHSENSMFSILRAQNRLNCFPNLEHLSLSLRKIPKHFNVINSTNDISLPKLTSLTLDCHILSLPLELSLVCKNLKSLELYIHWGTSERPHKYKLQHAYSVIEPLLRNSQFTLKRLALRGAPKHFFMRSHCRGVSIPSDFMIKMLELVGPQLHFLEIDYFALESLDIIHVLQNKFTELKVLKTNYFGIHIGLFKEILPNVDIPIELDGFVDLFTNLTKIMDNLGFDLEPDTVNITKLDITLNVSYETFEDYLECIPNLVVLFIKLPAPHDLYNNDIALHMIGEYCRKLRHLTVQGRGITDLRPLNKIKGLLVLHFEDSSDLRDDGLTKLSLPELRELALINCYGVSNHAYPYVITRCKAIRLIIGHNFKYTKS